MSASSPGNGQYGGVLAGVKAKPSMWPTASLDTGCGHHPPAAARGSSKQLHHKIPTTEVPTESGEARRARHCADRDVPAARMLTAKIADGYRRRLEETALVDGIEILVDGHDEVAVEGEVPCLRPTLLRVAAHQLLQNADILLEETFAPPR
jgi:hypothetical protein